MGILEAYLRYSEFVLKQIKTAYSKHFVDFPVTEKFKKTNFAANHCVYV